MDDHYSLGGKVFTQLKNSILAGEFENGAELREVSISKKLGVSRTGKRGTPTAGAGRSCGDFSKQRCTRKGNYRQRCGGHFSYSGTSGGVVCRDGCFIHYTGAAG